MKALRNYPGVLTILLVATALAINGLVEYIDYQLAGPSFLAALGCVFAALLIVGVYEFKSFRSNRKALKAPSKA
ncbi:MAG TPA: hypothetical protein VFX23_06080 [Limnobacter sp.]|uniref:hypothetical protein n=1 Tax=Limnobacter sp. TaxID=2003368 RepID=UPI002E376D01|nr:hypothetical protein [Limnobacter sp.]HEX5485546.1 hypothetical protein [Limnobacter sp.]